MKKPRTAPYILLNIYPPSNDKIVLGRLNGTHIKYIEINPKKPRIGFDWNHSSKYINSSNILSFKSIVPVAIRTGIIMKHDITINDFNEQSCLHIANI
jgi:hypothetical protein